MILSSLHITCALPGLTVTDSHYTLIRTVHAPILWYLGRSYFIRFRGGDGGEGLVEPEDFNRGRVVVVGIFAA